MEFNEFALVVFFVTLCAFRETKTLIMVLAIFVCIWFLTLVNAQQLMLIEGMQNNGNTTSLTVYLLFIVIVVLFLKRVI